MIVIALVPFHEADAMRPRRLMIRRLHSDAFGRLVVMVLAWRGEPAAGDA